MNYIEKIPTSDTCILHDLYQFLTDSCTNYQDMPFNVFESCSNSIYMNIKKIRYITDCYASTEILGIIGCRRILVSESDVFTTKYYPMKKKHMYKIEFLHHKDIATDEDIYNLIHECLADKNDGFIEISPKCELRDAEVQALVRNGFAEFCIKNHSIWLRRPITQ